MPEEPQDNSQTNEYVEPSTGTESFMQSPSELEPTGPTGPSRYSFGTLATPVIEPVVPVDTPSVVVEPTTKKSKKPLIVVIIIATVLAALLAGSSLVYGLWYQNPNKVVTDALMNTITSKSSSYTGTMNINSSESKAVISLNAKQTGNTGSIDATVDMTTAGKTFSLSGSALVDSSSDLYFKVEKLAALVTEFKDQLGVVAGSSQSTTLDQLVTKMDGNWIKVSSTDLDSISSAAKTAKTCSNDALNKFQNDKSAMSEVTNLYKKSPFIVVDKKIGDKDGSSGYVIKDDTAALKVFLESLKTTSIYKTLHACDNTFTIDTTNIASASSDSKKSTLELWVNSWSHQVTKVNYNDTASDGVTTTMTITPTINKPVQITTPKTSINLSQLMTDVQTLYQGSTSNLTMQPSVTDTVNYSSMVITYAEEYASSNRGAYPSVAQLKAYIASNSSIEVTPTVASAANPSVIGYVVCGTKGADVSYYDAATKTVSHESVGRCS